MSKFVEANEKIAEGVVKGYKKIEDGVHRFNQELSAVRFV